MATEASGVCVYIRRSTTASQHMLRVTFTENLLEPVRHSDAHMEILHQALYQLRKLQITEGRHYLEISWWAPQRMFRPRHLDIQEAEELAAELLIRVLADIFNWPDPGQIMRVNESFGLNVIDHS